MKLSRHHFLTIASTNTWAKEHVEDFELDEMTLVTADEQTSGRGRFKRVWCSPAGLNIYATFCFYIGVDRSDIGHVPQLLAISATEVLEQLNFIPLVKWPNDILIKGKKVAGILCEIVMHEDKRCVVCGIGLNVNMPLHQLQKIDRPATSLLVEGGQEMNVEMVLKSITTIFGNNLDEFLKSGFDSFFSDYQEHSYYKKGEEVKFNDNQEIVKGKFHSLNKDGTMTLQLNEGVLRTFYAGEFV